VRQEVSHNADIPVQVLDSSYGERLAPPVIGTKLGSKEATAVSLGRSMNQAAIVALALCLYPAVE
jgi:hypothetical protein